LLNRKIQIEKNNSSTSWRAGMKAYAWAFKKRKNIDITGGNTKNMLIGFNKNILGKTKEIPKLSKHSFSANWKLNLK